MPDVGCQSGSLSSLTSDIRHPASQFRVSLDEVHEGADVVGEAGAADAVWFEQLSGAGGVVGLPEEEVGDADAGQPREGLGDGEVERGADERRSRFKPESIQLTLVGLCPDCQDGG